MSLPNRLYYSLAETAEKLKCRVSDILHLGATGRIEVCAYINDIKSKPNNLSVNVWFESQELDEEITACNSIQCDLFTVAYFTYNDKLLITDGDLFIKGYYADSLSGFFAVPSESLISLELDKNSAVTVSPRELYSPKSSGIDIHFGNIDDLSISVDYFVVLASEIEVYDEHATATHPKYNEKGESDKTVAKKENIIKGLLSLIPELATYEIDEIPVKRLKEMIESVAAKRGVDFPSTDLGTWSKYLERGRHKK
ncbi:hypothetical protein [Serratia fonticola]|uniref:hypothetical protein n=1 Tax=Serratia fonticola TaxID=47917 RepID=UPI00301C4D00